jgi:hypothetical protein
MPPKAKVAAASNGATGAPKSKGGKSSTTSTGTATPIPLSTTEERQEAATTSPTGQGRPEKAAYDAEQEKIKKDIDAVQVKLVCYLHSSHLSRFFMPTISFSPL